MHCADIPDDIMAVYNDLLNEIIGVPNMADTHMVTRFGHLMQGYAAGYYGYLWSRVFAVDMFYTKFYGHELDNKIGEIYKEKVISYHGAKSANDCLRDFLGRKPNADAFMKYLFE